MNNNMNEVWTEKIRKTQQDLKAVNKDLTHFKAEQKKLVKMAHQFSLDSKKQKNKLKVVMDELNDKAVKLDAEQHHTEETSAEAKKQAADAKAEYAHLALMVKRILQDEQIMEKGKEKNLEAVLATESATWSEEESHLRAQLTKLEKQVREQRVVLKKDVDALYAQRREEDKALKLERAQRKDREATEGYEPLSIASILQHVDDADMTLASSFTHEHMPNTSDIIHRNNDTDAAATDNSDLIEDANAKMVTEYLNQQQKQNNQFVRATSAAVIPETTEWVAATSNQHSRSNTNRASGTRRVVSIADGSLPVMRNNTLSIRGSRKRSLALEGDESNLQ